MVRTGPFMIALHPILKTEGIPSVWPPHSLGWLPTAVLKSGLFELQGKHH